MNNYSFTAGDDVYLKVGTTSSGAEKLTVDWTGTSGNRVIIGAYEGDGDFVMEGGETKPIVAGNGTNYPDTNTGLISVGAANSYVTIQDIKVYNSGGRGIDVSGDNVTIQRVLVESSDRQGVIFNTVANSGIFQHSEIDDANQDQAGSAIVYQGSNGLIQYNKVHDGGGEGINCYLADTLIVQYNSVWDNRALGIYFDHSQNVTCRYNLVYYSNGVTPAAGINLTDETAAGCESNLNGTILIYGNLLAHCSIGIRAPGRPNAGICNNGLSNVKIYNNTVVEPTEECILVSASYDADTNTSSEVKNNIFIKASGTISQAPNDSDITWSNSLWSQSQANVDDDAEGAGDVYSGDAALSKTSGWDSLVAGAVDGTEFTVTTGSDAIDVGTNLSATFTDGINTPDFTASPITMSLSSFLDAGGSFEIGGYVYSGSGPPPATGYTDILLWWTCDQDPLASASGDYPDALNPTLNNSSLDAALKKIGTKSLDCPPDGGAGVTNAFFVVTNDDIIADEVGQAGFWAYFTAIDSSQETLFALRYDADNIMYIRPGGGDDDVQFLWKSGGTNQSNTTSTTAGLTTGKQYWFDVLWDTVNNIQKVWVTEDGEAKGSPIISTTDSITVFATTPDELYIGSQWDGPDVLDVHFDNLMVTLSPDRDFYNNEVDGTKLANLTGYPTGTAGNPGVDDVGIWNNTTKVLDDNSSTAITSGTFYVGLEIDEQLAVLGNPDQSVLKAQTTYPGNVVAGKYYSMTQDTDTDKWVLVYEFRCGYTWDIANTEWDAQSGQRITDMTLKASAALALSDGNGTATLQDGDGNDLDIVTNVDGEVVSTGTLPLEVADIFVIGTGGDAGTYSSLKATVSYLLATDTVNFTDATHSTTTDLTGEPAFTVDGGKNEIKQLIMDGQTVYGFKVVGQ